MSNVQWPKLGKYARIKLNYEYILHKRTEHRALIIDLCMAYGWLTASHRPSIASFDAYYLNCTLNECNMNWNASSLSSWSWSCFNGKSANHFQNYYYCSKWNFWFMWRMQSEISIYNYYIVFRSWILQNTKNQKWNEWYDYIWVRIKYVQGTIKSPVRGQSIFVFLKIITSKCQIYLIFPIFHIKIPGRTGYSTYIYFWLEELFIIENVRSRIVDFNSRYINKLNVFEADFVIVWNNSKGKRDKKKKYSKYWIYWWIEISYIYVQYFWPKLIGNSE